MFIIKKEELVLLKQKQKLAEIQFWLIDMGRHCKVNIESTTFWRHLDLEPYASCVTSGQGHGISDFVSHSKTK